MLFFPAKFEVLQQIPLAYSMLNLALFLLNPASLLFFYFGLYTHVVAFLRSSSTWWIKAGERK